MGHVRHGGSGEWEKWVVGAADQFLRLDWGTRLGGKAGNSPASAFSPYFSIGACISPTKGTTARKHEIYGWAVSDRLSLTGTFFGTFSGFFFGVITSPRDLNCRNERWAFSVLESWLDQSVAECDGRK
jgi:hypothetical protein